MTKTDIRIKHVLVETALQCWSSVL